MRVYRSSQSHRIKTREGESYINSEKRPQPLPIRVVEINQNTRTALWTKLMRLPLLPEEIVLQLRLRVVEPDDVFAFGVNEKIAVGVTDRAVAFGDLAFAFWCQRFVEGYGVFDISAMAAAVVGFGCHCWVV